MVPKVCVHTESIFRQAYATTRRRRPPSSQSPAEESKTRSLQGRDVGTLRCRLLLAATSFFVATNASAQTLNVDETLTRQQIEVAQARKAARTPTQQKIDSVLLDQLPKRSWGWGGGWSQSKEVDKVEVDIRGEITPALLAEITQRGGTIHASIPESYVLSALIPLNAIEPLAERADVMAIQRTPEAMHNWFQNKEGVAAHAAEDARKNFNVDGSGVKVCVLSDSVRYLSRAKDNFSLGDVAVLTGHDGVRPDARDRGEGTTMLEVIHSIAPGAKLMFATVGSSPTQMASNIDALGSNGCNIIVDDVTYGNESPFQDDIISQAVN